jgi:transposase
VTDSWFGNGQLYLPLKTELGSRVHVLTMLRKNSVLYNFPEPVEGKKRGRPAKYGAKARSVRTLANEYKSEAQKVTSFVYGKERDMLVYERTFLSKAFKCPIKVIFAYYKNHFVALATTDLSLTVAQVLEYYSARWEIESGFKELKHDIGSQKAQVRLEHSVINHLNMCMLAITIIWIAVMKLPAQALCELTHNGTKTQYTFSAARKLLISQYNKRRFCKNNKHEPKNHKNSWLQMIIELVA